jgi:hypothetical protein
LFIQVLNDVNFASVQQKDQIKIQLLSQEFAHMIAKILNFTSMIVEVFEGLNKNILKVDFLISVSKNLNLTLNQQVVLGTGLTQSTKFQQEGISFLKKILNDIKEKGPNILLDQNIQSFLTLVSNSNEFKKEKADILKAFSKKKNNFLLSPFYTNSELIDIKRYLYFNESSNIKNTVEYSSKPTDLLKEIGYLALATQEVFLDFLSIFQKISEADISQMICLMSTTHTGLETNQITQKTFFEKWKNVKSPITWNIDNFVACLKKKKIEWNIVFTGFDIPGYKIKDQKDLSIITSIYKKIFDVKKY